MWNDEGSGRFVDGKTLNGQTNENYAKDPEYGVEQPESGEITSLLDQIEKQTSVLIDSSSALVARIDPILITRDEDDKTAVTQEAETKIGQRLASHLRYLQEMNRIINKVTRSVRI